MGEWILQPTGLGASARLEPIDSLSGGRISYCNLTVPLDERGGEPTRTGSMGSMAFPDGGLASRRRRIP